MVAYRRNKKVSKFVLIFTVFFYGIQMFFGNRGIPLIAVITTIWLYQIAVKKIDKKVFVILLICILPLSMLINVIREVRNQSGIEQWINNFGELMKETIVDNNPILDAMDEMGTTIYPVAYTIGKFPETIEYKHGQVYIFSIYSIISINTSSNSKNNLAYKMNIAAQMTESSGCPFGGSYIMEAYANFGWCSAIFMILIGFGLECLNRRINSSKNMITIVLVAYFLNPLLWTVRNVIVTLPRELVWYIVPTYIIYKMIYNKKKAEVRE